MSLLVAVFYWIVIPVLVFLIARGLYRRVTTSFQKRAVVAGSMTVFIGLLWVAAGEKWWLDYRVRELCAKDGGIRVYETVKLPPDKFNQWGQPNFYRPDQGENALGSDYVFNKETVYYRHRNPAMWRTHYKLIRRSDEKLLGESVSYSRRGGDLPGPWHDSSFGCPENRGDVPFLISIFVQQK